MALLHVAIALEEVERQFTVQAPTLAAAEALFDSSSELAHLCRGLNLKSGTRPDGAHAQEPARRCANAEWGAVRLCWLRVEQQTLSMQLPRPASLLLLCPAGWLPLCASGSSPHARPARREGQPAQQSTCKLQLPFRW
jgi:hypothetical protein